MSEPKILDCTLRDGAYLIDKTFGNENIHGIVNGLVKAKIDFIEIGFFQNDGFGEGKTVFKNSKDASQFIPKDKNDCLFTVLADCSRYDVGNLDDCTGDSIDAVRECFFKHEIEQAMDNCIKIKKHGYLLFVQPVDLMGYTDKEILDLIDKVNVIEPYCISIVDTFGSMYQEDLHRLFSILHYNLSPTIKIGFHSHNNLQLSSALSQEFLRLTLGKRDVVVDSTLAGMGRGAGNTPTELVAQYMVSKMHARYDMDSILDILDTYMENIRCRCSWGYNTQYFVAGCYSAHVNNVAYLKEKNSIRSKDIRFILNKIGISARKRYLYDLLEKTYINYLNSEIDDSASLEKLNSIFSSKTVLVLVPGSTLKTKVDTINEYIKINNPIVVAVNVIPSEYTIDYLFISNLKRYEQCSKLTKYADVTKILTSNIPEERGSNSVRINILKVVKCGWEHLDNSTIMLLRLLDYLKPSNIGIAGFDGYDSSNNKKNYYLESMELSSPKNNANELNDEIYDMFKDYVTNRVNQDVNILFVTESRFSPVVK